MTARNAEKSTLVLIPGAGGMASYWNRVASLLELAHQVPIPVDLPGDDPSVSLNDYADIVVRAIGTRSNAILVAHSLGGFTAPLVCARVPIRQLIFVNAMIPEPGETAGAWWGNTGAPQARIAAAENGGYSAEFDLQTYFLHDVPEAVLRDGPARPREQSDSIFQYPCGFRDWPAIPIHVVASADDRFFPLDFQRRVAIDRLGKEAEVVPGGHLVALSRPTELVDLLLRFEREPFQPNLSGN
jgi:pimeloyl-ACP methyl ester carboxylesterase